MKLIEIFNSVRDLPYHCPESKEDIDHRCWEKHRILYSKLKRLGYNVRYRVCEFKWNEMNLPKEVSDKAPKNTDYHLYLEVEINGKWIKVDCSYDSKLGLVKWDGKTDTKICVKCLMTLSPEESEKIEEFDMKNYDKIIEEYHELYVALNKFLEKLNGLKM